MLVEYLGDGTVRVTTASCIVCKSAGTLIVPKTAWFAYMAGDSVQAAFSMLSAEDREQLVSGIHGPCFDSLFPDEDDEEDDAEYYENDDPLHDNCENCGTDYGEADASRYGEADASRYDDSNYDDEDGDDDSF